MALFRQAWTLTKKNLLVVFVRHWFFTTIRAFLAPIVFMFIISYAKNFFVPPSQYGIGSPTSIRSLSDALAASTGNHNKVVFVNNGFTGGEIESVISNISAQVQAAGKTVEVVQEEDDLLTSCASSLRGATTCYGAVVFNSSPNEGTQGVWNYTLRADGAFGEKIYVDKTDNDVEIYILPLQRAVDSAIGFVSGNGSSSALSQMGTIDEYPFTDLTSKQRDALIRRLYMGALINILAVAYFIGICGVTYQLTGQMASERELGISQLVEAMTPSTRRWHTQAARLLSNHLAFDIIYIPGWIIMGAILRALSFIHTSWGILIIYHILAGLALSSFSILGASLFNKAQLSGITVTMVCVILAIIAQVSGPFATGATAVLSLIFPSMNYVFFIIYLARFEKISTAANLAKGAPSGPSTLPGIVFWVLLIIQIIVYPFLGALVERWLYGTVSKERKTTTSSLDHAIVLSNFSKHWVPSWFRRKVLAKFGLTVPETVYAVNDLNLKARRGQILVLLGANGSGKSTTLDAISGLNTITSGSIEIDGTGGLGLCPQKNVLWDELTVFEHIKIFNQLKSSSKGGRDQRDQIEQLIRACDLGHKIKAKSKTLSGGQKRKLQLAMMFTGGSKVCCVDEVSSGLDPLSRRKIWDILLAERGERTFLLTTHFLDEADVLSDYVAIMSKGYLKTKGTAVQLKHEVDVGYRISVPKAQGFTADDSVLHDETEDKVVYWLPNSAEVSKFISRLSSSQVQDYDILGPTLEDVFLTLADEIRESGLEDELSPGVRLTNKAQPVDKPSAHSETSSTKDEGMRMTQGQGTSIPRQTLILIRKRFTILRRNYLPYLAAFLVPVITSGLVTLFLRDFSAVGCNPGDQASNPTSYDLSSLDITPLVPLGPSSLLSIDTLTNRTGLNATAFHLVDTLDEFNDYIATNFQNVTPGGFFLQPNQNPEAVMAYIGNGDVSFGLVTLNALSNVVEGVPITTSFQSFAVPFAPSAGKTLQLILYFGLAMSVYPAFFALYPCVERLRNVRALHYSNGIRAGPLWLAYLIFDFLFVLVISAVVTGIFVGASSVWYAPGYLFVVFFLYGMASILLCYVISLFTPSQLACFATAAGGQAVLFLLYFIMYMSIITYTPAYRITSDLTTAHFAYSIITPAGSLLRSLLLTLNEFSLLCDGTSIASYPGQLTIYGGPILYLLVQSLVLFTILVWFDSGYKPSILTTLSRPALSDSSSSINDPAVALETKRIEAQTPPDTDSLRVRHLNKFFGRANHAVQDMTFGVPRGEVFALLGPNGAGKSTTISLIRGDIRPSSSAGGLLLAGGGLPPGDVLVSDLSISAQRAAARQHLGVCPQFDAMDSMTVREHLFFYASARGVPDVQANVEAVLAATGLGRFSERLAHKLSGGNKRKLSLGIALMGNPAVLLLDEPSSGMDAAAKRAMWRTLLGVAAPGRALLITTHSMEEADRLATRVGIMKRRMLALGTGKELGQRWGEGVVVQVVLKSAPSTTEEEMDRVKSWLARRVAGCEFEKWGAGGGAHGLLRFRVRNEGVADREKKNEKAGVDMGQRDADGSVGDKDTGSTAERLDTPGLIQLFEAHRDELNIEYYSVSPTTLDEVFLRVVGREEEDDRETSTRKRFWHWR
ncbi:P-loop containing nucleoside triphosphate hydrolase protein [Cryphonectria parasitica EP155]|uniref:P-loop containing nucleoside triphosphate hydrolase protein n=1 Tax=Cryphonectria parasitica (strain ATCC 38755 / EP155) TaxID=660469 RepID=A0A9P4YB36_CRYP1|nr:P-loop containing nucleoside triphosphate hydrolase protein [Cryphonectria parasitica EP155]KAF3769793.1 P-loop containing nucleoside triphosphate hydrolase protein [Cryphonectria parasitica EP155]